MILGGVIFVMIKRDIKNMDIVDVKKLYDEADRNFNSAQNKLNSNCGFFGLFRNNEDDIKETYLYLGQILAYGKIMSILNFENEVKMIEDEISRKQSKNR